MLRLLILLPIPLAVLFIPRKYVKHYLIVLSIITAVLFGEMFYSHQTGGAAEAVGVAIVTITLLATFVLAVIRSLFKEKPKA